MKTYKFLTYMGIIFIVGSIIGFPLTLNHEIRFVCCMFTLLGMHILVNANLNKQKYFQND